MNLYASIGDDLLSKILDGTYELGQTIPTEMELAASYGVSRSTIRQALQSLVSTGYLEKRKRRGTIVTRPKVDQSFAMGIASFEDDMRRLGRSASTNVIALKRTGAQGEVADALGLPQGQEVYKLVRLRSVDGQPNVFVESYVPALPYPGLDEVDLERTSLYDAMDGCGRPVATARRRLEVTKADATTAALLDVEVGDPLYLFHTVARDEGGTPVEYSVATYHGQSNSFEFEVTRR
ncbi:MAG: GntR family transcriptional regulator [Atopobiaceae bacterium]|jgi:GntR family transcriptional regulator|nr:GntR family transcriptional regulator [Atopobiaceae bacterium]